MTSQNRSPTEPGLATPPSEIERSEAWYLFAISVLSPTSENRITPGELQEFVDVTPASVSEMMGKLAERSLVDYKKYHGVILTERGEAHARRVAWRICAVSSYFDSVLDTSLDTRTAFDIGFVLPEAGVNRLQDLVSTPCLELCPAVTSHSEGCPV